MRSFVEALKAYTRNHSFDAGNGDAETVLDQLYQAYAESRESDLPEISNGFKELDCFLESLPLSDNNAILHSAATYADPTKKKPSAMVRFMVYI